MEHVEGRFLAGPDRGEHGPHLLVLLHAHAAPLHVHALPAVRHLLVPHRLRARLPHVPPAHHRRVLRVSGRLPPLALAGHPHGQKAQLPQHLAFFWVREPQNVSKAVGVDDVQDVEPAEALGRRHAGAYTRPLSGSTSPLAV